MKLRLILFLVLFFAGSTGSVAGPATAELIFVNGTIVTMDDSRREAGALAIADGKIAAIGNKTEILRLRSANTRIVDLRGNTVLPGFIDAHSHFSFAAGVLDYVDLSSPPVGSVTSVSDIVERLRRFASERKVQREGWIIAWGYDPDQLKEKRHPEKSDLDIAFPDNPVFLMHVSGHLAVVNSAALKRAGIDRTTTDPAGGTIVRDRNGEPTGLLQESAVYGVQRLLPAPTEETAMGAIENAQRIYASNGITTAQDGMATVRNYRALTRTEDAGKMIIDVEVLAGAQEISQFQSLFSNRFGIRDKRVRLAGVKAVIDGSPQGKTAFFSEPYLTPVPGCENECRGKSNITTEQLRLTVENCYRSGIQLFVHANGDAAIDMLLSAHQAAAAKLGIDGKGLRTVVIHSQFVRRDQLSSYAELGFLPSFFSNHAYFWGDVHTENLGKARAEFLSPLRTAARLGLRPTNHTDHLVTPLDQFFLIWTAVNRRSRSGQVIGASERISVWDALKAVTINAAYEHYSENVKGSLVPGKLGDLVIVDKNPLKMPKQRLREIKVLETFKEGKSIFRSVE